MKQHGAQLSKSGQFVHSFPVHAGILRVTDFDLEATLDSGQSFQWRNDGRGGRSGWIEGKPFRLWQLEEGVAFESQGGSASELADYLQTQFDTAAIKKFFLQSDPFLARAIAFSPGLRILRQDPWECLAGFILSSTKQVAHIVQIWAEVARRHGRRREWNGSVCHAFPRPAEVARLSEADLRACKMGFRAKFLLAAARAIDAGRLSLELLHHLSTREARSYLMRLPGVGAKIADCVLLFSYARHDAFPKDVWMERMLRLVYFGGKRKSAREMEAFVTSHFGEYAGYAQQFLYHFVRNNPNALVQPASLSGQADAVTRRRGDAENVAGVLPVSASPRVSAS